MRALIPALQAQPPTHLNLMMRADFVFGMLFMEK